MLSFAVAPLQITSQLLIGGHLLVADLGDGVVVVVGFLNEKFLI